MDTRKIPYAMLHAAMPTLLTQLGLRLAELRREAELTQSQVADLIGVDRSTISYLEKGEKNPRIELFERLPAALQKTAHVDVADLFNFPWPSRGGTAIPWRHIARELVRLTPPDQLGDLVHAMEAFSLPLAKLLARSKAG